MYPEKPTRSTGNLCSVGGPNKCLMKQTTNPNKTPRSILNYSETSETAASETYQFEYMCDECIHKCMIPPNMDTTIDPVHFEEEKDILPEELSSLLTSKDIFPDPPTPVCSCFVPPDVSTDPAVRYLLDTPIPSTPELGSSSPPLAQGPATLPNAFSVPLEPQELQGIQPEISPPLLIPEQGQHIGQQHTVTTDSPDLVTKLRELMGDQEPKYDRPPILAAPTFRNTNSVSQQTASHYSYHSVFDPQLNGTMLVWNATGVVFLPAVNNLVADQQIGLTGVPHPNVLGNKFR